MPNRYVFADEAGCFTFKRKEGASKYFLLCTLATEDRDLSHDLLSIRRELVLAGETDRDKLHATSDAQATRDKVYERLSRHAFVVDVTLLEKAKAQPETRTSEWDFYGCAWRHHFMQIASPVTQDADKVLITAAAIGQKKTKAAFKQSINNSLQGIAPRHKWEVTFIDSAMDPLLWAADYCAWAIQRKWEKNDERSYALIQDKIRTECDLWKTVAEYHY